MLLEPLPVGLTPPFSVDSAELPSLSPSVPSVSCYPPWERSSHWTLTTVPSTFKYVIKERGCYAPRAFGVPTGSYSTVITWVRLAVTLESFLYHFISVYTQVTCFLSIFQYFSFSTHWYSFSALGGPSLFTVPPSPSPSPHFLHLLSAVLAKWMVLVKTMTPGAGSRARKGKEQKMMRN